MPMIWEGTCSKCGAKHIEFFATKNERDDKRLHSDLEPESKCDGEVKRNCYPTNFAVKWMYGPNDKTGCFMGPSKNVYKTDTTERARIRKDRVVSGKNYSGPAQKDRS